MFALHKEVEKEHTFTTQAQLRPLLVKDTGLVSAVFIGGYDKAQYILNPKTGTCHPSAQLLIVSAVAKRLNLLAGQSAENF